MNVKSKTKLWAGRFEKKTDKLVEKFTESISFDKRLFGYDIQGSIAHIQMLAKQKIVSEKDKTVIVDGLKKVLNEINSGKFVFSEELEDIHMHIESRLSEIVGKETGGRLHTARSRNDQVVLDVKLFLKDQYQILKNNLKLLLKSFVEQAENNIGLIMPGFTHLQHAQPVYLSHYLLAYFQKFKRDLKKLEFISEISDECPLGAGALAGTSHNIDRFFTSKLLGFAGPTENSIDTVSDRDFILDYLYVCSLIAAHLSQISEEFIIWSSQEYNYIALDDSYTTGSSIMPNKKNPDVCELTRGKSGRIISNLNALFVMIKGLPLAYNRDLQDDKKILFESADIINLTIPVFAGLIQTVKFNRAVLYDSLKKGFLEATDVADYLVEKKVPFREAHGISGNIVKHAISKKKSIQDFTIEEFKNFSEKFSEDIFRKINYENIAESRKSYGAASLKSVKLQIKKAKKYLNL